MLLCRFVPILLARSQEGFQYFTRSSTRRAFSSFLPKDLFQESPSAVNMAAVMPSSSNGLLSSPGARNGRGAGGAGGMLGGLPSSSMDVDDRQQQPAGGRQQQQQRMNGNNGARNGRNGEAGDEAIDEDEANGAGGNRRRARPKRYRDTEDIPRVRDETGERVREGFEQFLTKYGRNVSIEIQASRKLTFDASLRLFLQL